MQLLYLPFTVLKIMLALSLWFTFAVFIWAGWQERAERGEVQAQLCGDEFTQCWEADLELHRRAHTRRESR